MRKVFLALCCLALALLAALVIGTGLGVADDNQPIEGARPAPTSDGQGTYTTGASPDAPLLPDLVVEIVEIIPPTPLISEPVLVEVTIKNQGGRDLPDQNTFYTDLYVDPTVLPIQLGQDGELEWPCQDWYVPMDGSHILMWPESAFDEPLIFTDVKVYAIYAQVDTDNHVAESNENNNVFGPLFVTVKSPNKLVIQSHQEFQLGYASGLDISHPDGVMRRGIFWEPFTEPEVYQPDVMINDITGTMGATGEISTTRSYQARPALTGDGNGTLFAAWEDNRNGYWNRDILFSRSDDGGVTWGADVTITVDITGNSIVGHQASPDLAFDPDRGRVYAVWQDGRVGPNKDNDIYFAYSDDDGDTWTGYTKLNDDKRSADQSNPSIVVGTSQSLTDNRVYVVWQDRRNGNYDVYLVRSDDGGQSWSQNYFVTDDPDGTLQDQKAPSVGVDGMGQVYVVWEDWRDYDPKNPQDVNPEIYTVWSWDEGETFGLDVPMTPESEETTYRLEPTMAVSTTREEVERWDPVAEMTITEICDITAIHVAWQEGQGDDADVYYSFATFDYCQPDPCPYPYDFCFKDPQLVSGLVIDMNYALPPDNGPTWPISPTWQGQVSIARAGVNDWTYCHADSDITYTKGIFLAWSDARSYDDWRYEIRTRRVGSPEGDPKTFDICEDQATGVLNDSAKLYAYRNDWEQYQLGTDELPYPLWPAATGQANPYLYAEEPPFPSFEPQVHVAWDDDRWDKPLEPGTVRNRDVFFARMAQAPEAIYISPVFDAGTPAAWYVLDWWGATQHFGDLLLQTRYSNEAPGMDQPSPPPHVDVATGITATTWTSWTGNPSSEYLGCEAGAGCFYDAPGRHLVDTEGYNWILDCQDPGSPDCPEPYRYIQYKVIIRGDSRRTALGQVVFHFKSKYRAYIPFIFRNY